MTDKHPHERLAYLDSSRGIAAIIVLLSHFQLTILPGLTNAAIFNTPFRILFDGQAAVLYFFVLSGFVLSLALKHETGLTLRGYVKFIVSRIFRILPAFFFGLLFYYLVLRFVSDRPSTWLDRFWVYKPEVSSIFEQALLVVRIPNEPELRLMPHDWTLSIELAVSILLPVLIFSSRLSPVIVLLFVYGAVKLLHLEPFSFDFSLGIFIAMEYKKHLHFSLLKKSAIALLSLTLISISYTLPSVENFLNKLLIHHQSWGVALLLFLLLSSLRLQKLLSRKALVFIGKVSYSFYLLHLIILFIMTVYLNELSPLAFLLILLCATFLFSWASFKFIEKPFIKLGYKIVGK